MLSSGASWLDDRGKDVLESRSGSLLLESDRLPSPIPGAAEDERGGGKVASLIVKDIHSMPIMQNGVFDRERYPKNLKRLPRVASVNNVMVRVGELSRSTRLLSRVETCVKRGEAEIRPCPNRLFINRAARPGNAFLPWGLYFKRFEYVLTYFIL